MNKIQIVVIALSMFFMFNQTSQAQPFDGKATGGFAQRLTAAKKNCEQLSNRARIRPTGAASSPPPEAANFFKDCTGTASFGQVANPAKGLQHHIIPETIELCCRKRSEGVPAAPLLKCGDSFFGPGNFQSGVDRVQSCISKLRK